MPLAVDPQQLKVQMAADDFAEAEVTAAKRKLINFNKPATQQNLTLVMSMTRMLKGKNFTASIFKNAEDVHVQSLKESQKVIKVPKINCPDLDEGPLKQWIIHPESLSELPENFDARTHWLVDDGCDREALGPGCRHIDISMRKDTVYRDKGGDLALQDASPRLALQDAAIPLHNLDDGGTGAMPALMPRFPRLPPLETCGSAAARSAREAEAQQDGERPCPSPRVLAKEDSLPGDEVELILDSTEEAFSKGNLVSHDPQAPCASYWCRYFSTWARRMHGDRMSPEIAEAISNFPKFVAHQILTTKNCFAVRQDLLDPLKQLRKWDDTQCIFKEKGCIDAMLEMCQPDALTKDMKFEEYLKPKTHRALIGSEFYRSYLMARYEKKKSDLLAHRGAGLPDLVQGLRELHSTNPDDGEVLTALTLLGPDYPKASKTALLLKPENDCDKNWEILNIWHPSDARLPARILFKAGTDYKKENVSKIMSAFEFVETDAVADAIVDPVCKQLAKDNLSFKKLVAPLGDACYSFIDGLLAEMVMFKPGSVLMQDCNTPRVTLPPDVLKVLKTKVVKKTWLDENGYETPHHQALHVMIQDATNAAAEAAEKKLKKEQEDAAAAKAAKEAAEKKLKKEQDEQVATAAKEAAAAETAAAKDGTASDAGSVVAAASVGSVDKRVEKQGKVEKKGCAKLKVGGKVHCVSRKKKWNDLSGKIIKVSKSRVKVKLDHAVDGEKFKEYAHDSVSLLDHAEESDGDDDEPIVTAKAMKAKLAGTAASGGKKKLSVKGGAMPSSSEEAPLKKQRTDDAAEVLPEKTPAETPVAATKKIDLGALFGGRMID